MEILRIILFVLSILLIIITLIVYVKTRKLLKNTKVLKKFVENQVKLFTILTIITGILSLIAIIFNIILKNNNVTNKNMILDVENLSLELKINENEDILELNSLNDTTQDFIKELSDKRFDGIIELLFTKLIEMDSFHYSDPVILLYGNDFPVDEFENKIESIFANHEKHANIIVIKEITDEDIEFAKKHSISFIKAAYIKSLARENNNLSIDDLVSKTLNELEEYQRTGNYCTSGYRLEKDHCFKEIGREDAISGMVCPIEYYEYQGKCYKEVGSVEGTKEVCPENLKMENGMCIRKETYQAEGVCEKGEYDFTKDVCYFKEYFADANEYCRDSGRTLYEHKCLATKPTLNGTCLGNDVVYKGKCVNMKNDYQNSDWSCPGWKNGKPNKSEILDEETHKCYKEAQKSPLSYKCEGDFTLESKMCIHVEMHSPEKERLCLNGYTKVNDRCINMNDTKTLIDGYLCDKNNAILVGSTCIIYDIIEAKHN